MTSTTPDLPEFAPYFRRREAHWGQDDALMRSIFELRFQVYCVECKFLPADRFPDHREVDEHDANSAHFCAFNLNDQLVGYVRLVRPDAWQTFPFQSHCPSLFEGITLPDPSQTAEISRLMVIQDYRRRRGDNLEGVTAPQALTPAEREMRNNTPQILLSLFRQMYVFSLNNGIRYLYAAMERSLAMALAQMHFGFRQIGPVTDYYGKVAPYLGDLRELEILLGQHNPEMLAWMHRPESTDD